MVPGYREDRPGSGPRVIQNFVPWQHHPGTDGLLKCAVEDKEWTRKVNEDFAEIQRRKITFLPEIQDTVYDKLNGYLTILETMYTEMMKEKQKEKRKRKVKIQRSSSGLRRCGGRGLPCRHGQVQEPHHTQPVPQMAQKWHQETPVAKIRIS